MFFFAVTDHEMEAFKELASLEEFYKNLCYSNLKITLSGPKYFVCLVICAEIVKVLSLVFGGTFCKNITLLWTTQPRTIIAVL